MKQLAPFIVLIVVLITIGAAIVTLTNYNLKRRIIEKGPLDDNAFQFLNKLSGPGSEMLKWGLILLSGGLGLIVLEFVPYSAEHSSLPYGIETVFIALGFLTYFFIARKGKHKGR